MIRINDIEAAIALGPLGERSDYDLMPEIRERFVRGRTQRPAAVLCGIVSRPGGLAVVLTRRAAHLKQHAGQISFPGGKVDATDRSPEHAARREALEEIGMQPQQIRILGVLDEYLTGTAFRVHPFVAEISPDWQPELDPGEVAEVFEVPLDFLMDPRNRQRHSYEKDGMTRHYYAIPWGDYYIWGATAGMLKGLSDRLELLTA